MRVKSLSRYKLRRSLRAACAVQIFLHGGFSIPEEESPGMSSLPLWGFLTENRKLLERVACSLYDVAWPRWREYRAVQVSLGLLAEAEMVRVNGSFRGVDAPTDVLSFPLFEEDGCFVPPAGMVPLPLGDVLLCPSVIGANAREHGVSVESEAVLVIFHGMLHLLAWDHDTAEQRERMWKVQERSRDLFLKSWGEEKI